MSPEFITGVAVGGAVFFIGALISRFIRQQVNQQPDTEQLLDQIDQQGYRAHLYLPSVGHYEDQPLAEALTRLSNAGYIITDADDNLVGKVATARFSSEEIAQHKRAIFHIVK